MDSEAVQEELPILKRLGAFVRKGRERKGWSQQNLAEFVGISRDVIKRIETGDGDARSSYVFRILPVLGCTAEDIKQIMYGRVGANRT